MSFPTVIVEKRSICVKLTIIGIIIKNKCLQKVFGQMHHFPVRTVIFVGTLYERHAIRIIEGNWRIRQSSILLIFLKAR